VVQ
jgi:hypothetical protein